MPEMGATTYALIVVVIMVGVACAYLYFRKKG